MISITETENLNALNQKLAFFFIYFRVEYSLTINSLSKVSNILRADWIAETFIQISEPPRGLIAIVILVMVVIIR